MRWSARDRVLCFTHGEAYTLNQGGADLRMARAAELRLASAELVVTSCTMPDYPDAGLAAIPPAELQAHVAAHAIRHRADGLLVFDDTGITGHADHRAATAAVGAATEWIRPLGCYTPQGIDAAKPSWRAIWRRSS